MTPSRANEPLKLLVLISGGGTTLRNLIERIDAGRLDAQIVGVVSSSPKSRGLVYAENARIPAAVIEPDSFATREAFSDAIFARARKAEADVVVMAGFLKRIAVPPDYTNRVTNIHPGLIPAFCGKGYYGHHVHQAVLDYGAKISGCTVHFADNEYDHGPVILQQAVPVFDDDTADTLAARVFEAEKEAYPAALQLLAERRVRIEGRRVRILPAV